MKLKFLGTGTSQGVPVIGSDHPVCLSANPKDKRTRASALMTTDEGRKILIDCGPDFRQQMLSQNEKNVDAVLLTHEHNDHVIGLDDLRPIIFRNGIDMPIYCMERVGKEIKSRFPYAFADVKYPGAPSFEVRPVLDSFRVFGEEIIPVKVQHYIIEIYGYRIRNLAYITDANSISEHEMQKLENLDTLVINCLRRENPHPAHFILQEVLELVKILKPKQTYLTHISHLLGFHADLEKELGPHILPAYDGLEIDF